MVRRKKRYSIPASIPVRIQERAYGGPGTSLVERHLDAVLSMIDVDPERAESKLTSLLSLLPEEIEEKAYEAMDRAEKMLLSTREFQEYYAMLLERRKKHLISGPMFRRTVRSIITRERVKAALRAIRDDLRPYIFILGEKTVVDTGESGDEEDTEG
jgi:hypothetical protein